jgi:hypothetical protein
MLYYRAYLDVLKDFSTSCLLIHDKWETWFCWLTIAIGSHRERYVLAWIKDASSSS